MTIGTGGQVFVPLTRPLIDPGLRLHTFCHAPPARWYLLGAMLSAGMALRWLRSVLGREGASYAELVQLAAEVQPGSEGLFFLPYLVGERSPLMDPEAKAGFIGLALRHGPGHFVRALLEGVAFALRQIVDTMVGCGADLTRLVASGNGLANPIWRQIVADILNRPLCQGTGEQASERAGVGAAMIAGIGSGVFDGYQDAQKLAPIFNVVTEPNRDTVALYEPHYRSFLEIYPRMKSWRARAFDAKTKLPNMIVPTSNLFKLAYGKYAIGAYNINNMEQTLGLFKGAIESQSPFIIQLSKGARKYADKGMLEVIIRKAEEIFPEAVFAVHLDHSDEATCYDCIESGFYSSVMIDASHEPFEENVATTNWVVERAHAKGLSVEAELGRLGGVEEDVQVDEGSAFLTDPKEAVEFVVETGSDSLAAAIGASHGPYKFKGKQNLHFEVIREIQKLLPGTPIVITAAPASRKRSCGASTRPVGNSTPARAG